MNGFAGILEALAALSWPLLVLFVFVRFAPALNELISSARSRKFTLKVGGQELSMEEVRAQQSNLIADLQNQVASLREALSDGEEGTTLRLPERRPQPAPATSSPARILWVDDQIKNNSYYVEQLTRGGVEVDLAENTAEGLRAFANHSYRLVVSDIGRKEGDRYNRDAGMELLRDLRKSAVKAPVVLFTSGAGVKERAEEATALGADLITDSGTELVQFLRRHLPEWDN